MHTRSARWFRWRVGGLVTEPSSRFHAVCERRRKDERAQLEPMITMQPGAEDY